MNTGIVKFYNTKSGFGFIKCNEDGKEYYVHSNDVEIEIKADDKVSFELKEAKRGPQAIKVKKHTD
ncbi:MAG: cold shock domain-containing protein [Bacteroidota bacterium]|nr:cold shock domain-containing protein [Bacteroidota bacterium]